MKNKYVFRLLGLVGGLAGTISAQAQLTLTGQLRTRTELRDGYGNLLPKDAPAAAFTSQRTRLSVGYKVDRLSFGFTAQDVRVWGQDASTITAADGNRFSVHEAWAELQLLNKADTSIHLKGLDQLSVKVGRQELDYDGSRLLGNLDWLQQGRRFDAALIKARHRGWALDLGGGFNQNSDAFGLTGTAYTPGNVATTALSTRNEILSVPTGFIPTSGKNGAPIVVNTVSTNGQNQQFKAFQMAHLTKAFKGHTLTGLFFKDDFSRYRIDSTGSISNGYVYGRRYDVRGVNSRVTYGAMLTGLLAKTARGKFSYLAFAYAQSGRDRDGLAINGAHYYGINLAYLQNRFTVTSGYETLTGNQPNQPAGTTRRFDPLYGTPHKYWGTMDYFYVGTGSPVGGLQDAFLKVKYTARRFTAGLDVHYFALESPIVNRLSEVPGTFRGHLGNEYDFMASYALNKFTAIELGYSLMQGSNQLEYAKQNTLNQKEKLGQWGYLMLNIRPDFLAKSAKP